MLAFLSKLPPGSVPAAGLQFVLIALLFPPVSPAAYSFTFWDWLTTVMQTPDTSSILRRWLSRFSVDQLNRVLGSLKAFLTINFQTGFPEPIQRTVQCLKCVWQAGNRILPLSAFYHSKLGVDLNLMTEAYLWNDQSRPWSFMRFAAWLLDPVVKSRFLSALVKVVMDENGFFVLQDHTVTFTVRRHHLLHDAFEQIAKIDKGHMYFKLPLKIKFEAEEAVDGGGVKAEFFQLIVQKLKQRKRGLFVEQGSYMWFSKSATDPSSLLAYRFIGSLFAMAIYQGLTLDFPFPPVLYRRMSHFDVGLSDLLQFDPALAQTLDNIVAYDGNVEEDMNLFFEFDGVPLCENGDRIPVTNKNRWKYCNAVAQYLLVTSVREQFNAFTEGFSHAAGDLIVDLFSPEELKLLMIGREELDFVALEKAARYEGYSSGAPTVQMFWQIVHQRLTTEERRDLLYFVTSSPRAPIRGLGAVPLLIARDGEASHLPTAHTCAAMLVLPDDPNEERLYQKLLVAIAYREGFGFK
jgi:hypothetical protein